MKGGKTGFYDFRNQYDYMRNMGVSFEIPNKYGNYLSDILQPFPIDCYQWSIDNDEIHLLHNNEFTNEFLFNDDDRILSGERLYEISKNNTYYMIFVTLRAFFKDGIIKKVTKYEEFLKSDCQVILAVYDCSYAIFWCKDSQLIADMYKYALSKSYKNVKYICEEDLITDKYPIE